jgi:hypothetical protein
MHVHWTDQESHDKEYGNRIISGELQRDRMRDRLRRVNYVNNVLTFYGLRLNDWSGSKYILFDKKGNQEIINDLGDLWPKAEKMSSKPIDPLDPKLLVHLQTHGDNSFGRRE